MKVQRLIAIGSLVMALAIATAARAQTTPYVPIPNETGIGAGQRFINDINNRLSGAQAISPAYVKVTFAQLGTIPEVDGWNFYCVDCTRSPICAGGPGIGTGAVATGVEGGWSCGASSTGTLGGDVTGPLSSNVVNTVLGGHTPVTTVSSVSGDVAGSPLTLLVQGIHFEIERINHSLTPVGVSIGVNNTMFPCDASGGPVVLQTNFGANENGKVITLKKTDSSSNTCTFDPFTGGSSTVEGQSSYVLSNPDQAVVLYNGNNLNDWGILATYSPSCKGAVTLSAGAGTFSNTCVTTTSVCQAVDKTTLANSVTLGATAAGSVTVAGTGTDVVEVACH